MKPFYESPDFVKRNPTYSASFLFTISFFFLWVTGGQQRQAATSPRKANSKTSPSASQSQSQPLVSWAVYAIVFSYVGCRHVEAETEAVKRGSRVYICEITTCCRRRRRKRESRSGGSGTKIHRFRIFGRMRTLRFITLCEK